MLIRLKRGLKYGKVRTLCLLPETDLKFQEHCPKSGIMEFL